MPLTKCYCAVVAAAHGSRGAALLLRAIDPIGKAIVGRYVVKLRGRLVVPRAPRGPSIHGNHGALIARQRDRLRMLAANPNAVVVVSGRCSPEAHKCFSGVAGFPGAGVRDVNYVRILGRDGNPHRARAAATDASVAVNKAPRFSLIIRPGDSRSLLSFHRGVHAMRFTRRNRDAGATQTSIVRRWQPLRQLPPDIPSIRGLVAPAPG